MMRKIFSWKQNQLFFKHKNQFCRRFLFIFTPLIHGLLVTLSMEKSWRLFFDGELNVDDLSHRGASK